MQNVVDEAKETRPFTRDRDDEITLLLYEVDTVTLKLGTVAPEEAVGGSIH